MKSVDVMPVSLIMQPIALVSDDAPLAEVRDLLIDLDLHVPAIAVVDADRTVIGVLTRTDVLRSLTDADATARDAMSMLVFSLPAESSVESAAALMAYEGIGQLVITAEDGTLVGMVSALDVARHVAVRAGYLAA